MKPGDIIEWVYKDSGELVQIGEFLWSSMMESFVPIGGEMVHFLVSINDRTYSWLNAEGLFHARVDDDGRVGKTLLRQIVPRTRANPLSKEAE